MKTKKRVKNESKQDMASILAREFSIQVMSEDTGDQTPYRIPFRHRGLQYITGGVPGGRLTEVVGDSQTAKSYLAYELISSVLDMGGQALLHDVEAAFEPRFGKRVGISGDKKFFYSKNKSLENFFSSSRRFIKLARAENKTCPILVVLDSYPPLQTTVSLKEIEKMKDAKEMKGYRAAKKNAVLADLIGEFITFLDEQKAALVVINQGKVKMGVMFGDPRTSNGDNIFKFYATLRIWGRLGRKIKEGIGETEKERKLTMRQVGVVSNFETIKNRAVYPFKKVDTKILYAKGLQTYSGFMDLLVREGRIKLLGKDKFSYNKKVYPLTKLRKVVQANPELLSATE